MGPLHLLSPVNYQSVLMDKLYKPLIKPLGSNNPGIKVEKEKHTVTQASRDDIIFSLPMNKDSIILDS